MKYSVIMYNFNGYEIPRPLPKSAQTPNIDYIYITDSATVKPDGWRVIIDPSLQHLSTMDKCYSVRFNLFNYTSSNICLYMDGSMQILADLTQLFKLFEQSNDDIGLMIHPDRTTMFDEYCAWFTLRNYPKQQGFKCLQYMQKCGYDIQKYKGLYQGGLRFIKNTSDTKQLDIDTYKLLKFLGSPGDIERIDQTIYSFLVNAKYTNLRIFPFSQHWIQSSFIKICPHGSPTPAVPRPFIASTGYVRNKFSPLYTI